MSVAPTKAQYAARFCIAKPKKILRFCTKFFIFRAKENTPHGDNLLGLANYSIESLDFPY